MRSILVDPKGEAFMIVMKNNVPERRPFGFTFLEAATLGDSRKRYLAYPEPTPNDGEFFLCTGDGRVLAYAAHG